MVQRSRRALAQGSKISALPSLRGWESRFRLAGGCNVKGSCTLYGMSEREEQDARSFGRHNLPPASFEFLILSLRAQTEMQLGLFQFGEETEKQEPELDLARHTIDMMNVLLE